MDWWINGARDGDGHRDGVLRGDVPHDDDDGGDDVLPHDDAPHDAVRDVEEPQWQGLDCSLDYERVDLF